MKRSSPNIALIFFSRSAHAEIREKKWFNSKIKNLLVAETLIKASQKVLSRTNLPVFHFNEQNQTGDTFGEKLANAYEAVFAEGYEAAIAVGNDTLQLNEINWSGVIDQLESGNQILGPSLRGGLYLIGLQKEFFNKDKFAQLKWQTSTLFDELKAYTENKGELILLPRYRDVNSYFDIIRSYRNKVLPKSIALLLSCESIPSFFLLVLLWNAFYNQNTALRAPPF